MPKQPTSFDKLAIMTSNGFDAQQKYIDNRFLELRSEFRHDIAGLKQDISGLKKDVVELKQDVSVLKEDVSEIKRDVSEIKRDVGELQRDVRSLDRLTDVLVTEVGHIKKVLKRLPTQKNLTNLKKRVYVLERAR
jgi:chromosome segregation ATPase